MKTRTDRLEGVYEFVGSTSANGCRIKEGEDERSWGDWTDAEVSVCRDDLADPFHVRALIIAGENSAAINLAPVNARALAQLLLLAADEAEKFEPES
jgi:hypothetical protein